MQIINPATEEVISEVLEDTHEALQNKFDSLQRAASSWRSVPLPSRVEVLRKFSNLLSDNISALSSVLTSEVGKPVTRSKNEIKGAIERIRWLAANAEKYLSDEVMVKNEVMEEKIVYEPLGVVCNISAWNYPYLVGVNVFVPALMAGNTVMYKPSEYATLTGLEIERLLKMAGVPSEVFQVGIGGSIAGEVLLDLPFDGYFFTGSYKTGKHIHERVATKMVPCQLELGGKDPLYVAEDVADVDAVAAATADGTFYNNGQSCCSVERVYIHESIYDQYLPAFLKEVKNFKSGSPAEEDVYFGPLTRKDQIKVLEDQISDAISKGATLETRGAVKEGKGYYFSSAVLTNVTHDMRVMRDESFGPVIGIMKVKDDEEAVKLMKDSLYGLTASVYSSDETRARRILMAVNSGTGYWNCCDRVSAAVPWSGRGHSGIGSTLSHAGIRAFTKPKSLQFRKP